MRALTSASTSVFNIALTSVFVSGCMGLGLALNWVEALGMGKGPKTIKVPLKLEILLKRSFVNLFA